MAHQIKCDVKGCLAVESMSSPLLGGGLHMPKYFGGVPDGWRVLNMPASKAMHPHNHGPFRVRCVAHICPKHELPEIDPTSCEDETQMLGQMVADPGFPA